MIYHSKIVVKKGFALYIGNSDHTDFHQHHAIQIIIALQGTYQIQTDHDDISCQAILIQSNVNHKHTSNSGIQFSLFIDADTDLGHQLMANFPGQYHPFSVSFDSVKKFAQNADLFDIDYFIQQIFNLKPIKRATDGRIDKLIEAISADTAENLQLKKLISFIPLSESRIRHLFKAQTGISIQAYLLSAKIKKAFVEIAQNENLSQVAFNAGFSDYAHMSRTIKQMFGINLKTILKDSHYVQED